MLTQPHLRGAQPHAGSQDLEPTQLMDRMTVTTQGDSPRRWGCHPEKANFKEEGGQDQACPVWLIHAPIEPVLLGRSGGGSIVLVSLQVLIRTRKQQRRALHSPTRGHVYLKRVPPEEKGRAQVPPELSNCTSRAFPTQPRSPPDSAAQARVEFTRSLLSFVTRHVQPVPKCSGLVFKSHLGPSVDLHAHHTQVQATGVPHLRAAQRSLLPHRPASDLLTVRWPHSKGDICKRKPDWVAFPLKSSKASPQGPQGLTSLSLSPLCPTKTMSPPLS